VKYKCLKEILHEIEADKVKSQIAKKLRNKKIDKSIQKYIIEIKKKEWSTLILEK
jgi:hypothetical protein